MEDSDEFADWELLPAPTNPSLYSPPHVDHSTVFECIAAAASSPYTGAIKPDYFVVDSAHRLPPRAPLSEEEEDDDDVSDWGGVDSDNPSSVDPDPDRDREEAGSSDDSSISKSLGNQCYIDGEMSDGSEETEREEQKWDAYGPGNGEGREEGVLVWWKTTPLEILKRCTFGMNPIWSLSMAAVAFFGIAMVVRRRMSKTRHQGRRISLRIAIDDKSVTRYAMHAARANEAISITRCMPIIRAPVPAGDATPWSMVPV